MSWSHPKNTRYTSYVLLINEQPESHIMRTSPGNEALLDELLCYVLALPKVYTKFWLKNSLTFLNNQ